MHHERERALAPPRADAAGFLLANLALKSSSAARLLLLRSLSLLQTMTAGWTLLRQYACLHRTSSSIPEARMETCTTCMLAMPCSLCQACLITQASLRLPSCQHGSQAGHSHANRPGQTGGRRECLMTAAIYAEHTVAFPRPTSSQAPRDMSLQCV